MAKQRNTRRGKGEGSISLRRDGRWQGRVDLGRDEQGRRQYKAVYGSTRQDVASKLNEQLGLAEKGELLVTTTPTVTTWLESWFTTHKDDWAAGTQRVYRCAVDQWIAPALGSVRLEKLKPVVIQRWIALATKDGASAKMVLAHTVLHEALGWAMQQRMLTFNPASLVKVPRPKRKPIVFLTAEQGRVLVDAAPSHRLGAMFVLSFACGLRIGEAGGVAWPHLDLAARALDVRQQIQPIDTVLTVSPLKTRHSKRTLTLPEVVVGALKTHRTRQLEERLRAGDAWQNEHDLVFTTETGRPMNPSSVRYELRRFLKAAGLKPLKYHGLRHSCATLLLTAGVPLFDVSRILGHASIDITADVYGHFVPEMAAGAAAHMDGLLKTGSKA